MNEIRLRSIVGCRFLLKTLSAKAEPMRSVDEMTGEPLCESQKFSTAQALLLNVEIVKARFLPSGDANGVPRIELVVHNSEILPLALT